MSFHLAPLACAAVLVLVALPCAAAEDDGVTLTLDEAIRRTRELDPALRALTAEERAARERVRDANRRPNPSLGFSIDNFGGSLGGRTEATVLLEQPFEMGGDRAARAGLARSLAVTAGLDREIRERERIIECVERFCDAWVLQERIGRLEQATRAADRAVEAAAERLRAGAGPAFEGTRAAGYRTFREIELRRAEAGLAAARHRLAALWDEEGAAFDSLRLAEPSPFDLPPPAEAGLRLAGHPILRRAVAESSAAEWRTREARAARTPDLQIAAGARHLEEAPGTGLVAGVSLPLPLWNRGAGTVDAARSERDAAIARQRQAAVELRAELEIARVRWEAAFATWQSVRDRLHPAASEALQQILAAYRAGRLGYLDVQEGQRALLEAELLFLETSADAWKARFALTTLLGALDEEGRR